MSTGNKQKMLRESIVNHDVSALKEILEADADIEKLSKKITWDLRDRTFPE
jgi:hypothetical protein